MFGLSDKRFYIIAIFLFIMWSGIMLLFYLKADEVTKDPCSVCAKRMNEEVVCSIGGAPKIMRRTYYPNFSIVEDTLGYLGG